MAKKKEETKKKTEPKKIKKVKLNDKKERYISEEASEIRRFVFILMTIVILLVIVYGVTKIFVKDDNSSDADQVSPGVIDYDIVTVGTMLTKADKEYYVMIYDAEDANAVYYSAIINNYLAKEKALNVYFCDLGNKLNNSYYVGKDGKSNPKAEKLSDLALKELTLIKVKNGKIVKYIENIDTIKSELKK